MKCDAIGPDLSAYADGELGPEDRARIEGHLDLCGECRRAVELWREAGCRLRSEDGTPDLAARFREASAPALRSLAKAGAGRLRRRWLAIAGAAAALLIVAISYRHAMAEHEVRRLVELEDRNREKAVTQLDSIDGVKHEIAALLLEMQALDLQEMHDDALEERAAQLISQARDLEARVGRVQESLIKDGLRGDDTPDGGGR